MIDFLYKNSEIRHFLANFSKKQWNKAIEASVVYGIRMIKSHNVPLNVDSLQDILSPNALDIQNTLKHMKKELYQLNSAIKQIEIRAQNSINLNDFFYSQENFFTQQKTRNNSTQEKQKKIEKVSEKDRPFTPNSFTFSTELKEPKVCPINDAYQFTKHISQKKIEKAVCHKFPKESYRSRASISTQPTSPLFTNYSPPKPLKLGT